MNQTMNAQAVHAPSGEYIGPYGIYSTDYMHQIVEPNDRKRALKDRVESLKSYIYSCIQNEDWHGVRDAATDIEVAKAKLEILNAR